MYFRQNLTPPYDVHGELDVCNDVSIVMSKLQKHSLKFGYITPVFFLLKYIFFLYFWLNPLINFISVFVKGWNYPSQILYSH